MRKQPFSTGSSSLWKLHVTKSLIWYIFQVGKDYSQEKDYLLRKNLLLSQGGNFGTVTKPFNLLTRTILAAPDTNRAHCCFQSARKVVISGGGKWNPWRNTAKTTVTHVCSTCKERPAKDHNLCRSTADSAITFSVRRRKTCGQWFFIFNYFVHIWERSV